MQRKATLIYNPTAGPVDRSAMMTQVAQWWQMRGWQISLQPTKYAGHAAVLAREAVQTGQQMVLAAGGDGTLSEVANELAGTDVILAPLPAGTGNSLAKEFLMPRPTHLQSQPLLDSAESLHSGRVQKIDLLQCDNGRHCMLWLGAGLEAHLIKLIEPRPKWLKRFGVAGYFVQTTRHLLRLPQWTTEIELDGTRISGEYSILNVSNCRYYLGGMLNLCPQAQWDDGLFEVVLFDRRALWQIYRLLLQARFGRHLTNPHLQIHQCQEIVIRSSPAIPVQIDGDPIAVTPVVGKIRPKTLNLLVPQTAPHDLFAHAGIPLQDAI